MWKPTGHWTFTLAELIKKFNLFIKMKQLNNFKESLRLRGLSLNTIEAYADANRKFLDYIKKDPVDVKSRDIKRYIINMLDRKQKPKTINLNIAALKSFYDDYRGRRLFVKIRRLKLEKSMPNVLSKYELKAMIDSVENKKHRLAIKFLYSTGIRVGELVKVKIQDLDLENGFLRVIQGKGKKDRITIISKELCREIKEFIKPKQKYLFESSRGGHLTIRSIQEIIKKAAKKAKIKRRVYPHALRASFATHLYEDGIQLQKIQKLMGHADWKTTLEYAKTARVGISDIKNPLDSI
ncbi:tyrosine-type recombinase/integrase [Candidatus Pacearchaeota archaeon]|nr:tyrosine-type recombinase/integrase [Candidatus Pacearchaeota archaeon]